MKVDILILRVAFVGMLILLGYLLNPFERTQRFGIANIADESTRRLMSAGLGALVALLIIGFEMRVRRASLKTLIGAAAGSILGIIGIATCPSTPEKVYAIVENEKGGLGQRRDDNAQGQAAG